jgi:hypothetical protein
LATVARELEKYKLDLVGVHVVRWNRGGYIFLFGNGNENCELGTRFLDIRGSYQQLRG